MTDDEFSQRLTDMRETMYRISYTHLARSQDRDDAVQETLLKAWSNRHKLKDERYMQTWVVRILINECRNIQRKHKKEIAEVLQADISGQTDISRQTDIFDSSAALREALFKLEEKLRVPVVLHYIEGFNTREIAKMLGIPKGTVLWRLSKAREKLSTMLSDDS